MVSAKPVVSAVDLLEAVGELRGWGRPVGAQPAAGIGEPTHVHRGHTGHGTEAQ